MELLRGDVVAAAGSDDDADSLIDGVDALKDVVGVTTVGVAVLALDVNDDLATGGGKGVIAEGKVQVVRGGVRPDGGGLLLVGGGGEGEAGLPKGSEGGEGSSRWEPLARLEKDVGTVGRAFIKSRGERGCRCLRHGCSSCPSAARLDSSAVVVHGWASPITVSQRQEHLPCRARGRCIDQRRRAQKRGEDEEREEKRERKKGRRDRIEKRRRGRRRGALLSTKKIKP